MNLVLVIPHLTWGGAMVSALALAQAAANTGGMPTRYTILVTGDTHPAALALAQRNGMAVLAARDTGQACEALEKADLVHVQFWNTPEMYAWLRAHHPPMRLLVTLDVTGEFPAQCVLPELVDLADWTIATSAYSLGLDAFRHLDAKRRERVRVILPGKKMQDVQSPERAHADFRVGYAGTVDPVKMHPRYIELCAAIAYPGTRFPIMGGGDGFKKLERQATERGIAHQLEWYGFREDYLEVMKTFDVMGYPLCRETYATSDIVIQDAMWLGVPPVILGHGALPLMIRNGETGIVAQDEKEYALAVQRLGENPSERAQLGANARAYAQESFGADKWGIKLRELYDCALQEPKSEHRWRGKPLPSRAVGAAALCEAFGGGADPYLTSLHTDDPTAQQAAERRIANAKPVEMSPGAGGILDYRRAYPEDPFLCLWAGLVLGQQGRYALAAGQFHASVQAGLPAERAQPYLKRVMRHLQPFEDAADE